MNIENVKKLIVKKLNKSNFYEISDKRSIIIKDLIIENGTFGIYIYILEEYQTHFYNDLKCKKWNIGIRKSVFEKSWNDELKLADKIYKLIYADGEKSYSYNGRLLNCTYI